MNTRSLLFKFLFLTLLSLPLGGCQKETPALDGEFPVREAVDTAHNYEVRGRLVEIRQGGKEALIAHEAIPGYMAAMTMPFAVKSPSELGGLIPGDAVAFRYEVQGASSWIAGVSRLSKEETATMVLNDIPDYTDPSEASLYFSGETWTNQEGINVRLAEFRDRPVVLSMIFTNCGYACPLIVHDMKRIGAQLPVRVQERVQYVLVSLDPDRDTPEALRYFAEGYGLNLNQWTLLRGEEEQVRILAALLGVRYRQQADGQFAHTSLISILNEQGEIVHQQKGLGADGSAAANALGDLFTTAQ